MARHLTTLVAFGSAFIAGATPFVLPWPAAAIASPALLVLFWALLEDRDELAGAAARGRACR